MFIKIPPWDVLSDTFGLDGDGDIGEAHYLWNQDDESILPEDRIIEIADKPDEDEDYEIIDIASRMEYIHQSLLDICEKISSYGSTKFLRRPYATDRRDI